MPRCSHGYPGTACNRAMECVGLVTALADGQRVVSEQYRCPVHACFEAVPVKYPDAPPEKVKYCGPLWSEDGRHVIKPACNGACERKARPVWRGGARGYAEQ